MWEDGRRLKEIERDRYGMGVAANVLAADGQVMRTVGVHAVSGASLPGFERHAGRVDAERRLTVFVLRQKELAEERGWLLIVLGDLNSVCSPTKDIWKARMCAAKVAWLGRWKMRGCGIASWVRHPELRGFTYYEGPLGAAASRIDGVCGIGPRLSRGGWP